MVQRQLAEARWPPEPGIARAAWEFPFTGRRGVLGGFQMGNAWTSFVENANTAAEVTGCARGSPQSPFLTEFGKTNNTHQNARVHTKPAQEEPHRTRRKVCIYRRMAVVTTSNVIVGHLCFWGSLEVLMSISGLMPFSEFKQSSARCPPGEGRVAGGDDDGEGQCRLPAGRRLLHPRSQLPAHFVPPRSYKEQQVSESRLCRPPAKVRLLVGEIICFINVMNLRFQSYFVQWSGFGISYEEDRHKEALFVWDRSEVQGGFERIELG